MATKKKRIYRVLFHNDGRLYEVYARQVTAGMLLGFVEVEGLLFGERSQVVVDPAEERLKTELAGVERFHVPLHAVVRIDEVEKRGVSTIRAAEGAAVTPLPAPIVRPLRRDS